MRIASSRVSRSGVSGMTIDDMATALGVSKGSFYAHFTNRDDLLRAVLDGLIADERDRARLAVARAEDDPSERLKARLVEVTEDVERSRLIAQIIGDRTSPMTSRAAAELADLHVDVFRELLERSGLDRHAATVRATAVHAALIGYWLSPASTSSPVGRDDFVSILHADAITAPDLQATAAAPHDR